MELIILGISTMFFYENADYFAKSKEQYKEGYKLEFVGIKGADENLTSIPIKAPDGKEYIMFKMKY
tara:strand:- start:136 stop:333 length:198 start_codon:yes stop_codon:yes gene_type:complete